MNDKNHLIVFAKNAELGKVKTRLAKTIGDEKTLFIYQTLLAHAAKVAIMANATREISYSKFIEEEDFYDREFFSKTIQKGEDLGERMHNAFLFAKNLGKEKTIIIGTDCYELDFATIERGFTALDEFEVVFGPAKDGGYYLVGLKNPNALLFLDKEWSHENVLKDAVATCEKHDLSYSLLKQLSDVDNEEDLGDLAKLIEE